MPESILVQYPKVNLSENYSSRRTCATTHTLTETRKKKKKSMRVRKRNGIEKRFERSHIDVQERHIDGMPDLC